MKLSLVVAQGVHSGKAIPISVGEFIIGRDPQCQLRPASPAVSKQHCGITQRDGKVFVRDCGSTNGTFVNEEQVAGDREVKHGDKLKVGPLEFTISIEVSTATKPEPKKAPSTSTSDTVMNEATLLNAPKLAPKKEPVAKAAPAPKPEPAPAPVPAPALSADDDDSMAAMLLGLDDGPTTATPTASNFNPDSTTVMEMPALNADKKPATPTPAKEEKKKPTGSDNASAAAELLSKYMRRPRT